MTAGDVSSDVKKSDLETNNLQIPPPIQKVGDMETGRVDKKATTAPSSACSLHQSWERKRLKSSLSRGSVGTCLVVFALPLLIPGVTLTAVAFGDETGFTRYSALHIIGMVMLTGAGLLVLVGVALLIKVNYKVVPEHRDGSSQSLTTHRVGRPQSRGYVGSEVTTTDLTGQEKCMKTPPPLTPTTKVMSSATILQGTTNAAFAPPTPVDTPPSKTPLNFLIEPDSSHVPRPHQSAVASLPPITAAQMELANRLQTYPRELLDGYFSSTDEEDMDDLDSDDKSSGSYVISGENAAFHHSHDEIFKDNATPETSVISRPGPSKPSLSPRSRLSLNLPQSHNFFYEEENKSDITATRRSKQLKRASLELQRKSSSNVTEESKPETSVTSPPGQANARSEPILETRGESPKKPSPKVTLSHPSPVGSPRARLEAFSNATALASTMNMRGSEDLLPENMEVEMTESNGSVFTGEDVHAVLESDRGDGVKWSSADDVVHNETKPPPPPPSVRTFTFDFDYTPDVTDVVSEQTGDDGESAPREISQSEDGAPTSARLVGILKTSVAHPHRGQITATPSNQAHSPFSNSPDTDTVTAAIFSPSTVFFNSINKNNSKISGGISKAPVTMTTTSASAQTVLDLEPVPLRAKKRATFPSAKGDNSVNVTYHN